MNRIPACRTAAARTSSQSDIWWPLAGVDNKDGSYRCRSCGKLAVPLDFASEEERDHSEVSIWTKMTRQPRSSTFLSFRGYQNAILYRQHRSSTGKCRRSRQYQVGWGAPRQDRVLSQVQQVLEGSVRPTL